MKVSIGLALFSLAISTATASDCDVIVAFGEVGSPLPLPLDESEVPATPLYQLDDGRIVVGTMRYRSDSNEIVGGRLLVSPLEGGPPTVARDLPSQGGDLPPYVDLLEVSPDGRYFAASNNALGGGPLHVFRTEPIFEERPPINYQVRRTEALVTLTMNLLEAAARGNPLALAELERREGSDDLRQLYAFDPERTRTSLEILFGASVPGGNRLQPVPATGVRFHPQSHRLLVNVGPVAVLQDAASGRELRRIPLPPGGASRLDFAGGGTQVVAVTTKSILLYDAASGLLVNEKPQDLDHFANADSSLSSPDGKLFATRRGSGADSVVSIWSVGSIDGRPLLLEGNRIPGGPRISFARGSYAVGTADGKVELHSADDHRVLSTFTKSAPGILHEVLLSPNGVLVATVITQQGNDVIELRNTKDGRGIRLQLPPSKPGWRRHVQRSSFAPDGGRLLLSLVEFDPNDHRSLGNFTVHQVDVYRALARFGPPKNKEP